MGEGKGEGAISDVAAARCTAATLPLALTRRAHQDPIILVIGEVLKVLGSRALSICYFVCELRFARAAVHPR